MKNLLNFACGVIFVNVILLLPMCANAQCQTFNTIRTWDTFGEVKLKLTTKIELDTLNNTITISEGIVTRKSSITGIIEGLNKRFTVYVTPNENITVTWLSWSSEPIITSVTILPMNYGHEKQYYNACWNGTVSTD